MLAARASSQLLLDIETGLTSQNERELFHQSRDRGHKLKFTVIPRTQRSPDTGNNEAYLRVDHWDDHSFVTAFDVSMFDESGKRIDLGTVKIGFVGQIKGVATYATLTTPFDSLSDQYFSLGQDVSYYRKLSNSVSSSMREGLLRGLQDIVFDTQSRSKATGQEVFRTSLLRSVSMSVINGQFKRVLAGGAPLSDFKFGFTRAPSDGVAGVDLTFNVFADSTPSTNIHAIIGRNGVGKTTILNNMTDAITRSDCNETMFYVERFLVKKSIDETYFSSLISVSFSAFDPFRPPMDQPDPENGTRYYYIGLKDLADDSGTLLKSLGALHDECVSSLLECFSDKDKKRRWEQAILTLQSDENFAQMNLGSLAELSKESVKITGKKLVERMSSGHAIVLLTVSRLVAKVEEKTLVLIDEPESHLHPPLLSAFTRALSELLRDRNGVAIVATHSPVVLQEIPRSCAVVITRSRLSMHIEPPRVETFGENVGVLTREIFRLEVTKSGFHSLLETAVHEGKSYDSIVAEYDGQIGLEARGILRAMIAERESSVSQA